MANPNEPAVQRPAVPAQGAPQDDQPAGMPAAAQPAAMPAAAPGIVPPPVAPMPPFAPGSVQPPVMPPQLASHPQAMPSPQAQVLMPPVMPPAAAPITQPHPTTAPAVFAPPTPPQSTPHAAQAPGPVLQPPSLPGAVQPPVASQPAAPTATVPQTVEAPEQPVQQAQPVAPTPQAPVPAETAPAASATIAPNHARRTAPAPENELSRRRGSIGDFQALMLKLGTCSPQAQPGSAPVAEPVRPGVTASPPTAAPAPQPMFPDQVVTVEAPSTGDNFQPPVQPAPSPDLPVQPEQQPQTPPQWSEQSTQVQPPPQLPYPDATQSVVESMHATTHQVEPPEGHVQPVAEQRSEISAGAIEDDDLPDIRPGQFYDDLSASVSTPQLVGTSEPSTPEPQFQQPEAVGMPVRQAYTGPTAFEPAVQQPAPGTGQPAPLVATEIVVDPLPESEIASPVPPAAQQDADVASGDAVESPQSETASTQISIDDPDLDEIDPALKALALEAQAPYNPFADKTDQVDGQAVGAPKQPQSEIVQSEPAIAAAPQQEAAAKGVDSEFHDVQASLSPSLGDQGDPDQQKMASIEAGAQERLADDTHVSLAVQEIAEVFQSPDRLSGGESVPQHVTGSDSIVVPGDSTTQIPVQTLHLEAGTASSQFSADLVVSEFEPHQSDVNQRSPQKTDPVQSGGEPTPTETGAGQLPETYQRMPGQEAEQLNDSVSAALADPVPDASDLDSLSADPAEPDVEAIGDQESGTDAAPFDEIDGTTEHPVYDTAEVLLRDDQPGSSSTAGGGHQPDCEERVAPQPANLAQPEIEPNFPDAPQYPERATAEQPVHDSSGMQPSDVSTTEAPVSDTEAQPAGHAAVSQTEPESSGPPVTEQTGTVANELFETALDEFEDTPMSLEQLLAEVTAAPGSNASQLEPGQTDNEAAENPDSEPSARFNQNDRITDRTAGDSEQSAVGSGQAENDEAGHPESAVDTAKAVAPTAIEAQSWPAEDAIFADEEEFAADKIEPQAGETARMLLDIMSKPSGAAQPQERALAADTLLRLLPKIPVTNLVALAERICMMETPPPLLVNKMLRHPRHEVAGPLLEGCSGISDQVLMAVISSRDYDKQRMIAKRRTLSPQMCDALIEFGDTSVFLTIVRNPGASLSHDAFFSLSEIAKTETALQAPLVTRGDTPAPIAFELFWFLPSELRRYVLSRFLTDSETLDKILKITLAVDGAESGDTPEPRTVDRQKLAKLVEDVAGTDIEAASASLAEVAGINKTNARRIISDTEGEPITVAMKAIGYPRTEFSDTVEKWRLGSAWLSNSERPTAELQNLFDSLSFNKARMLLTYWDWAADESGPYARKAA